MSEMPKTADPALEDNFCRPMSDDELDRIGRGPEIAAAVAWWLQRLGNQGIDNGDAAQTRFVHAVGGRSRSMTPEQKAAFAEVSPQVIVGMLRDLPYYARELWEEHGITLVSDYETKDLLSEAAKLAELPVNLLGYFPCKASVSIKAGLVEVRDGRGTGRVPIYEILPTGGGRTFDTRGSRSCAV